VVEIAGRGVRVRPVDGVSLALGVGDALALVGESGSGKTMTLKAILGILPRNATVVSGEVLLNGVDLRTLRPSELRRLRGKSISMVFQEPMTALNPLKRVGALIAEAPRVHLGYSRRRARDRALELMSLVGIPDPKRRFRSWPHELSGGMRQRVMIAMALSCEPQVVLCDEATTALDVTIQDQILNLLRQLSRQMNVGLVYVSHDLPVVAGLCRHLAVMYAGRLVESGPVEAVLRDPRHPYTHGLLRSVPDHETTRATLDSIPGLPPDIGALPLGCRFHPRCAIAREDCRSGEFPLRIIANERMSACRYPADIGRSAPRAPDVSDA
jgi:peptide/nickel transport system ATP-binding protein